MKKVLLVLVAVTMLFGMAQMPISAADGITVRLNNEVLSFDVPPQMISNRVMVPFRKIFEEMGAVVSYDAIENCILAITKDMEILAWIDRYEMKVVKNDVESMSLDVAPLIVSGRTLVPIRFIADAFGAEVTWDGASQTVYIQYDNLPEVKPASLIYNSTQVGSVTGVITYQYNKYVGTKPDVGAHVLLMQANHVPLSSDEWNLYGLEESSADEDPMIYSTEADGMGNYYFDNVPAGHYYLFMLSKETTQGPEIRDANIHYVETALKDKVSNEGLEELKDSIKYHSFAWENIEVTNGQTVRVSKDWGYTYY